MSNAFQSILVPVDLSPCSRAALVLAAKLAEVHDARLVILHALAESSERSLAERAEVQRFVDTTLPGHVPTPQVHVLAGSPRDVILTSVERLGCDVIVLGTHGRTGRARMLAGSVAESIVRGAACPVITVRSPD